MLLLEHGWFLLGWAFCWFAVTGKVSMADMLSRRGITSNGISDVCIMCRFSELTANHLFIRCEIALLSNVVFCGAPHIHWRSLPSLGGELRYLGAGSCFGGLSLLLLCD